MRIRVAAISMGIVEWPRKVSEGRGRPGGSVDMSSHTLPSPLVYDRRVPHATPLLDRIAALVPVRGLEGAKARLGEALDAEERRALVERLLRRTVEAALATPWIVAVAVVSSDPEVLALARDLGAHDVAQRGGGLNEGLGEGRSWAVAAGAGAILIVPVDLPAVSAAELGSVIRVARGIAVAQSTRELAARPLVTLVPDRAGSGTNVLLLAPPDAIAFTFGEGSRAAHARAAHAAGAIYLELDGPLTLDLDTPDDLLVAEALGLGGLRTEIP